MCQDQNNALVSYTISLESTPILSYHEKPMKVNWVFILCVLYLCRVWWCFLTPSPTPFNPSPITRAHTQKGGGSSVQLYTHRRRRLGTLAGKFFLKRLTSLISKVLIETIKCIFESLSCVQ